MGDAFTTAADGKWQSMLNYLDEIAIKSMHSHSYGERVEDREKEMEKTTFLRKKVPTTWQNTESEKEILILIRMPSGIRGSQESFGDEHCAVIYLFSGSGYLCEPKRYWLPKCEITTNQIKTHCVCVCERDCESRVATHETDCCYVWRHMNKSQTYLSPKWMDGVAVAILSLSFRFCYLFKIFNARSCPMCTCVQCTLLCVRCACYFPNSVCSSTIRRERDYLYFGARIVFVFALQFRIDVDAVSEKNGNK